MSGDGLEGAAFYGGVEVVYDDARREEVAHGQTEVHENLQAADVHEDVQGMEVHDDVQESEVREDVQEVAVYEQVFLKPHSTPQVLGEGRHFQAEVGDLLVLVLLGARRSKHVRARKPAIPYPSPALSSKCHDTVEYPQAQ